MSGRGEITLAGGPDDAADLRALERLLIARSFSTVFIPDMSETAAARAATPGLLVLTRDRREVARVYMGPRSGAYMVQLLMGPGSDAARVLPVMGAGRAAARIAGGSGVAGLLAGTSSEGGVSDVAE
ncbi:hypothetical protein [Herbidospora yilanensis]|uniref:hypothetical protein n=1 Tax=Herbidospora yilanensis TaxID=354426 RepID=UPI000781BBFA|nr:hypothetical protein [Herbidospora yilanensis]